MITVIVALVAGACIGILAMSLCAASKCADCRMEMENERREWKMKACAQQLAELWLEVGP